MRIPYNCEHSELIVNYSGNWSEFSFSRHSTKSKQLATSWQEVLLKILLRKNWPNFKETEEMDERQRDWTIQNKPLSSTSKSQLKMFTIWMSDCSVELMLSGLTSRPEFRQSDCYEMDEHLSLVRSWAGCCTGLNYRNIFTNEKVDSQRSFVQWNDTLSG